MAWHVLAVPYLVHDYSQRMNVMLPTTVFRRRNGYEDLDKCHQSLEEYLSNILASVEGETTVTATPFAQQKQQTNRIFSISETALNVTPPKYSNTLAAPLSRRSQRQSTLYGSHNQSTLSLNNGISHGSIVLLPSNASSSTRTQSYANLNHAPYATVYANGVAKKWANFCVRKENIRLLCFTLFYCVYLTIGSVCFQIAETPVEESLRSAVRLLRTEFLLKYPQISGKFYLCESICLLNIPIWGRSTPKRWHWLGSKSVESVHNLEGTFL